MAAKCDRQCPASNSGCCCHVMAVIWKLEDMTRKSELKNSTPDNLPCTSKPRQWGKGHRREVEFHPIIASNIVKSRHGSDLPGKKRKGILSQLYDPRPPKCQKLDVDGMVKLQQDLQSINPKIPFAAMLPDKKQIPTVETIVGTVAKGSIIHKQLQEFTAVNSVESCMNRVHCTESTVCVSSHLKVYTQGQYQPQTSHNDGAPDSSLAHVQKESDVPDITDLQLSLNAQSTGEPHVQILSVPQDTTQGQERLQSLSDNIYI